MKSGRNERAVRLADFAAGHDSPEAIELLREALRRWAADDGGLPLQRFLGLRTAYDFRRAERDRWLRAALHHAGNVSALARAVRRFERGTWSRWQRAALAPAHAGELDTALFFARRAGLGALPESVKHLRRIVGDRDTESGERVHEAAA